MFRFFIIFALLCSISLSVDVKGYESFPIDVTTSETTIKVTKDAHFMLVLSNPTAGFNWYLANEDELVSLNLIVALNLTGLTGEYEAHTTTNYEVSGGHTYFKFQATNSGVAKVLFEYKTGLADKAVNSIQVDVQIIDIGFLSK